MQEGLVLGHYISAKGIEVDPAKIEVIQTLRAPTKKKYVHGFLGYAGYYRRFIKKISTIASPLYGLLLKDVDFQWTPLCDKAFQDLKAVLTHAPILQGPNWNLPFYIYTDACDHAVRAVLSQKKRTLEKVVYFISENLQGVEPNYTVTEKEMLAVIYALNKFRHYITVYQVFVYIDHTEIRYLINKPIVSRRLARWLLLMQEFDSTIIDKPRKTNIVVDFLSRLTHQPDEPIIDLFFR